MLKSLTLASALVFGLLSMNTHAANEAELAVNPYGKVYSGEGTTVEMAILKEKNADGLNDVLLKITGADAYDEGIDGKVLRYTAVHAGTGVNFNYSQGGKPYTRMVSRSAWGSWTFFEVYLKDKTIHVALDEAASKESRPLHLVTEYQKTAKK